MEFHWIQLGWGSTGFSGTWCLSLMGFRWIQWDGISLDSVGWGSSGFSGIQWDGVPLDSVRMGFHWIQWDVVPQFDGIPLDSVGWGSTGFSGMGFPLD